MGKALNNKNLIKGVTQEKTGKYLARYVDRNGKRHAKRFDKPMEAKRWLEESKFNDQCSDINNLCDITVDTFFDLWHKNKLNLTKPSTSETYHFRYQKTIKPAIGKMRVADVKIIHCQKIINDLINEGKGNGTIKLTSSVLRGLFEYAIECDIISKNPCRITVKNDIGKPKKDKEVFTKEEQKVFLQSIEGHIHENQFKFVLQTGLRVGELIGLKWEDIDFKNRTLKVQRSEGHVLGSNVWRIGLPKSKAGLRTIPLTDEAIAILHRQQEKNSNLKIVSLELSDYVFLSNSGERIPDSTYNAALKWICKKANLKHISMHSLRHIFATRCAEARMPIKSLQAIMGHSKISTTMDLYVHTTDDALFSDMNMIADSLKVM